MAEIGPAEAYQSVLGHIIHLNQNRTLCRLRSKHAIMKCNYRKRKLLRGNPFTTLIECMSRIDSSGQRADLLLNVEYIQESFRCLEQLDVAEARSVQGHNLLLRLVGFCQDLRVLWQAPRNVRGRSEKATRPMQLVTRVATYGLISRYLCASAARFEIFRDA